MCHNDDFSSLADAWFCGCGNFDLILKILNTLWCRKRGMCGKRVMIAHLVCVLGVKRGMTLHLVKVLILKRDMSVQTGCFQYIKSSQNLGMILKRGMTIRFKKGLVQKRGMVPFIDNVLYTDLLVEKMSHFGRH